MWFPPAWRRGPLLGYSLALLCVPGFLVSGCGPHAVSTGPTSHAMHHPRIVPTKSGHPDALYVPDPIRVKVGQTITWTNRDSDPHDVTSDAGLFYSGPIAHGASWTWSATAPGTYPYFCTIHPDMHGEIIVTR